MCLMRYVLSCHDLVHNNKNNNYSNEVICCCIIFWIALDTSTMTTK